MDSLGWGSRRIDHDIALGNSLAFPGSGLVGTVADLPRVTEGVVEKDEVLGDFDELRRFMALFRKMVRRLHTGG